MTSHVSPVAATFRSRGFADPRICFNVRDLGGHPTVDGAVVRSGRLFRAASLNYFGTSGLPSIKTAIDLRSPRELMRAGNYEPQGGVEVMHLPMLQEAWGPRDYDGTIDPEVYLAGRYVDMLDISTESIAKVVETVADSSRLPLVVFCAAGKDRTGVVAAILLSTLGVSDELIVADFAASEGPVQDMHAWFTLNRPPGSERSTTDSPVLDAPARAMHLFLETLRNEHGDTDSYLRGIGVTCSALQRLRTEFTFNPDAKGIHAV